MLRSLVGSTTNQRCVTSQKNEDLVTFPLWEVPSSNLACKCPKWGFLQFFRSFQRNAGILRKVSAGPLPCTPLQFISRYFHLAVPCLKHCSVPVVTVTSTIVTVRKMSHPRLQKCWAVCQGRNQWRGWLTSVWSEDDQRRISVIISVNLWFPGSFSLLVCSARVSSTDLGG